MKSHEERCKDITDVFNRREAEKASLLERIIDIENKLEISNSKMLSLKNKLNELIICSNIQKSEKN